MKRLYTKRPRKRNLAHAVAVRSFTPIQWSMRHGTAVTNGRLIARTDTDYLVPSCPSCGKALRGGVGIGFEGMACDPDSGLPLAVSFRLDCRFCGLRDFFKLAVDEHSRYGTAKVQNPLHWARDGRKRG